MPLTTALTNQLHGLEGVFVSSHYNVGKELFAGCLNLFSGFTFPSGFNYHLNVLANPDLFNSCDMNMMHIPGNSLSLRIRQFAVWHDIDGSFVPHDCPILIVFEMQIWLKVSNLTLWAHSEDASASIMQQNGKQLVSIIAGAGSAIRKADMPGP